MRSIPLRDLNYVVFDFETTGLDARGKDEIVEIGAVKVNGTTLSETSFQSLVNPQRSIPASAIAVHGITPEALEGAPTIEEIMPSFLEFLGKGVLVAQNARFDCAFLVKNLARLNIGAFENPILDTMLLSKYLFSYEDRHNLDAIVRRLKIEVEDSTTRHRSVDDCRLTAKALIAMIEIAEERGLGTFRAIKNCVVRTGPVPIVTQESLSLF